MNDTIFKDQIRLNETVKGEITTHPNHQSEKIKVNFKGVLTCIDSAKNYTPYMLQDIVKSIEIVRNSKDIKRKISGKALYILNQFLYNDSEGIIPADDQNFNISDTFNFDFSLVIPFQPFQVADYRSQKLFGLDLDKNTAKIEKMILNVIFENLPAGWTITDSEIEAIDFYEPKKLDNPIEWNINMSDHHLKPDSIDSNTYKSVIDRMTNKLLIFAYDDSGNLSDDSIKNIKYFQKRNSDDDEVQKIFELSFKNLKKDNADRLNHIYNVNEIEKGVVLIDFDKQNTMKFFAVHNDLMEQKFNVEFETSVGGKVDMMFLDYSLKH